MRRGREKLHYLNPVPIHEIAERWIGKFERHRARRRSSELKKSTGEQVMSKPKFVYVTYIRTTPEKLWRGADRAANSTRQYWVGITAGVRLEGRARRGAS